MFYHIVNVFYSCLICTTLGKQQKYGNSKWKMEKEGKISTTGIGASLTPDFKDKEESNSTYLVLIYLFSTYLLI